MRIAKRLFCIFCALAMTIPTLGFVNISQDIYYITIILLAIYSILAGARKLQLSLLSFIFVAFISIFINHPPAIFKSYYRLIAFILILLGVGPLLKHNLYDIKSMIFKYLLNVLSVLSVLSFFCYFLGINYMQRWGDYLAIQEGWFSGLYRHSMMLGPFSAISALYAFHHFFDKNKKGRVRFFWLCVFVCCVGSTMLSASRSAFGGFFIGLLIMLYKVHQRHMGRYLKVIFFFVFVCVATYPFWSEVSNFLIKKTETNISGGSIFMSRETKIICRFIEFRSSPIYGIGFGCVDPKIDEVSENGDVEPGSSWLAIISNTGIIGIFCIIVFLCPFVRNGFRRITSGNLQNAFYLSIMVFFFFHMTFEGYIFASGNSLSILFWLFLSLYHQYFYSIGIEKPYHLKRKKLSSYCLV